MTKVTFLYEEGCEYTGTRTMMLTRDKDEMDLKDLVDFLADAARAAGYTYVEQVGVIKDNGDEVWSES